MTTTERTEEGFLARIEQGKLKDLPYYCDWLEDNDRLEEAEFWRWVWELELRPFIHTVSQEAYESGRWGTTKSRWDTLSFDWQNFDGCVNETSKQSPAALPSRLFVIIEDKHKYTLQYAESPTCCGAYKILLPAWVKWKSKHPREYQNSLRKARGELK